LGNHPATKNLGPTRYFYTDGSGVKVSKRMGAMVTGWAVEEVKMIKEDNLRMKIRNKWGEVSENLQSVQWCEAKAILEAIKACDKNERIQVHTDSKGTIQQIRSLLAAPYQKKRKRKGKEVAQEIIEAIQAKEMRVILEWVKGHEDVHMKEEEHNWIRKLKMKGNTWADEATKEVVEHELKLDNGVEKYDEQWSNQVRG